MTPDEHLAQLKRLIQPPYTNGWWAYAKARAEEIALARSDCAALPTLLHAERELIKAQAEASQPPRKPASKPVSTTPSSNVSRETTDATTRSATRRKSTGHISSLKEEVAGEVRQ